MTEPKDNVKVAIRIRPLNEKEQQEGGNSCVSMQDSQKTLLIELKPDKKHFTFDYIASENSSQQEIFEMIGKPISKSCLSGYNGTIFAYGQTGAGKTFTILGSNPDQPTSQTRGLLPRCFEYIFSSISEESSKTSTKFLIKCSYLEIYQEQIIDLLDPNPHNLQLREDIRHGVYVEGLIEETVTSLSDTYSILKSGTQNRHVACTSMNKESSRSHSVFNLTIESKECRDGINNFRTSRFAVVDLAGSERQKATDCAGERLKEAGMINKSLSALGNVINSLVDISEGKSRHVHYRDSKLTFLLKDSLGGNSKTFMVACVSPDLHVIGETLSTLKFAQRAKQIKNSAVVNEDTSGAVAMMRYEIKRLKDELNIVKNSSLCMKCQNDIDSSQRDEGLIELLQRSIKSKQEDERILFKQLQDKDAYISGLKGVISKLENKANHDKMILKFRDATIGGLQNRPDENLEIFNLKKEIEILKDQIDSNPQAAKLFVENEKLKQDLQDFKEKPDNKKLKELEEVNEKLLQSLSIRQKENDQIIEKLVESKEQFEKIKEKYYKKKEANQKLNEKISELELVNLTMQTENTFLQEESNLKDCNYDEFLESDKETDNCQKIDEILIAVNEQQVSLQNELINKLNFEEEIERLKQENEMLKEENFSCQVFKEQVLKMGSYLENIEKKQEEGDIEQENLRKSINDLKIQLETAKENLAQKQELMSKLIEKNSDFQVEIGKLQEKLFKTEESYKKVVQSNKHYQQSLENFESLQEKYDSLLINFKCLEDSEEKLRKAKLKTKIAKTELLKLKEHLSALQKIEEKFLEEKKSKQDLEKTLEKRLVSFEELKKQHKALQAHSNSAESSLKSLQEKCEIFKSEASSAKEELKSIKQDFENFKVSKITSDETSHYYREEYLKLAQDLESAKSDSESLKNKLKLEKEKSQIMQDSLESLKLDFAKVKLDLETRFTEATSEIQHLESELLSERKKIQPKKDLESKLKQFEEEVKILKSSADSFQDLNLVLTQKNAELTNSLTKIHSTHIPAYIAEQLRGQVNEMQNEILRIKEDGQSKSELLQKKTEANWKKLIDEKNCLIAELKSELSKSRERQANEESSELKYLKSALVNKEKELTELKEKGQEYYSQADEVLENMRKKCQSLQTEVNQLREEAKIEPRRNRSAFRENIDPKNKYVEEIFAVKHMNSVLTEELSKNVEVIELLKKRNIEGSKRLNEFSLIAKQYEEEIEKLSIGLGKITDFVFSIPMIKFNPEENSIIDSTIKAISLIYEASCRKPPRHCN